MLRTFNVAGPCNQVDHYMLPAQERCQGIFDLINQKLYFVIHAARQSGKSTLLLDLTRQIEKEGRYHAIYCSLEGIQDVSDPERGIPAIVRTIEDEISMNHELSGLSFSKNAKYEDFTNVLRHELTVFCQKIDKPFVILFDEIDCLSNGTLIAFLRQLRYGYVNRSRGIPFVHSVALVGMRNIRDYKAKIRDDQDTLGSASPFNIVTKSLTLRNFTKAEIGRLYSQHTDETGQFFSPEVIELVNYYTQGQPWLVNAIAREIVVEILGNDFSREVLPGYVDRAAEGIINRRDTHIDSLMERLREHRVQRIVEPVILGEVRSYDFLDDDYQYVLDLGLLLKLRVV